MSQPLALWLKQRYSYIRTLLLLAIISPALYLQIALQTDNLGINPLQALQQNTGYWAMVFLCITLTVTPLRRLLTWLSRLSMSAYGKRLSDWNWIIRTRRLFGLACFFYACLHLAIYLHFDLGYDIQWAIQDFSEKPYLIIGLLGFILLIPLAATSPQVVMKKMGRNWRKLHRLTYLVALIALMHYWLAIKAGIFTPWYFTLALIILLGYRLLAASGMLVPKPRDDGMEVAPRQPRANQGLSI